MGAFTPEAGLAPLLLGDCAPGGCCIATEAGGSLGMRRSISSRVRLPTSFGRDLVPPCNPRPSEYGLCHFRS